MAKFKYGWNYDDLSYIFSNGNLKEKKNENLTWKSNRKNVFMYSIHLSTVLLRLGRVW